MTPKPKIVERFPDLRCDLATAPESLSFRPKRPGAFSSRSLLSERARPRSGEISLRSICSPPCSRERVPDRGFLLHAATLATPPTPALLLPDSNPKDPNAPPPLENRVNTRP